jgi:hypothetical protein
LKKNKILIQHQILIFFVVENLNFIIHFFQRPSWWWSHGSWIYNYPCISPLALWVQIRSCEVCLIQQYVIKFVSDLCQVFCVGHLIPFMEEERQLKMASGEIDDSVSTDGYINLNQWYISFFFFPKKKK